MEVRGEMGSEVRYNIRFKMKEHIIAYLFSALWLKVSEYDKWEISDCCRGLDVVSNLIHLGLLFT